MPICSFLEKILCTPMWLKILLPRRSQISIHFTYYLPKYSRVQIRPPHMLRQHTPFIMPLLWTKCQSWWKMLFWKQRHKTKMYLTLLIFLTTKLSWMSWSSQVEMVIFIFTFTTGTSRKDFPQDKLEWSLFEWMSND